jgi:hypothetical protein
MMTNTNVINIPIQAPAQKYSITLSVGDIGLLWSIVGAVVFIAGIAAAAIRFRTWLDGRIGEQLRGGDVVGRLALLVKPDMIFDMRASVLADRGAASLIKPDGIHVTMGAPFPNTKLPVEIRIECVRHLAVPPLLTALNADAVTITTKRGSNFDWLYMIHYAMAGDCDADYTHRYRLEVF